MRLRPLLSISTLATSVSSYGRYASTSGANEATSTACSAESHATGTDQDASKETNVRPRSIKVAACTHIGYASGYKDANQDACFAFKTFGSSGCALFGVFDGHGAAGHYVSAFLKQALPPLVLKQLDSSSSSNALHDAFTKADSLLNASGIEVQHSGSTAVVSYLQGDTLSTAWVGDSRAVLGSRGARGRLVARDITVDHKPDSPDERLRILLNGGRVEQSRDTRGRGVGPPRVWFRDIDYPGLAMSRAFGDVLCRRLGVVAEPQLAQIRLQPCDRYLVLASDGVWEHMTGQEVVALVARHGDRVEQGCEALVRTARQRWLQSKEGYVDDITAVVVALAGKAG